MIAILSLAAAVVALWWFRSVSADYQLFAALTFTWALDVAASVATAVLAILLIGRAIIGLASLSVDGADPNGFQRASLYAVLAIVAAAAVLGHLGVNITAVFATSAVLTAILGFALQPSLGGLIGGLTLHTDRALRVGDAIVHNGQFVVITAFNWRSVSGRRSDGTTIVFPNARIVDQTIEILADDRPVRAETMFAAPLSMPPHRLSELVGQIVSDFAEVDDDQPVLVAPMAFEPEKATARYRVRYWLHAYADTGDLDGEILRGLWYALQREGIPWPLSILYDTALHGARIPAASPADDWPRDIAAALARVPQPGPDGITGRPPHDIAATGIVLHYAPSERIVLPQRVHGHVCLLVQGTVYEVSAVFDTLHRPRLSAGPAKRGRNAAFLSRRTRLRRISSKLAEIIGPYAETAVHRAAAEAASLDDIPAIVAHEIADPVLRQAFLAGTATPGERRHGPGLVLNTGAPQPGIAPRDTRWRAAEACAFVAIPPLPAPQIPS